MRALLTLVGLSLLLVVLAVLFLVFMPFTPLLVLLYRRYVRQQDVTTPEPQEPPADEPGPVLLPFPVRAQAAPSAS